MPSIAIPCYIAGKRKRLYIDVTTNVNPLAYYLHVYELLVSIERHTCHNYSANDIERTYITRVEVFRDVLDHHYFAATEGVLRAAAQRRLVDVGRARGPVLQAGRI